MLYDNAGFDLSVGNTLKALTHLKDGINATTAQNIFHSLRGKAVEATSEMNSMGRAADMISERFSAMGTIAHTVLQNITNKVTDTATNMLKKFTIDPISEGFREYELQMGSVQTILANTASKGKTIKDVNKALEELNKYSDQTIYNFGDMASNIGTFTAAGIDLDQSVTAIKGFSNVAGMAGVNATDTSRAMYQLSQSMSAGTVKLQDWISLEKAGVANESFKNSLIETAKVHGVNVDSIIKKQGSFRDSLSEGWITSAIMTETLAKYTGDLSDAQLKSMGYSDQQIKKIQETAKIALDSTTKVKTFTQLMGVMGEAVGTGWADTFKILIGDFEEARALWTEVYAWSEKIITGMTKRRNEPLQLWKNLGGRDELIAGLKEMFGDIGQILRPIGEAFNNIFPAKSGVELLNMTKSFREFWDTIEPGEELIDRISRIFTGFFSILDIGWMVIKGLFEIVKDLFGALAGGSGGFTELIAKVGDFFKSVRDGLKEGDALVNFFDKLGDFIVAPIKGIMSLAGVIGGFFGTLIPTPSLDDMKAKFEDIPNSMEESTKKIGEKFDSLTQKFKDFFGGLGKSSEGGEGGGVSVGAFAGAAGIGLLISKLISALKGGLGIFTGLKNINLAIKGVGDVLAGLQLQLKAGALIKIAAAIGMVALSMKLLSTIDGAKLAQASGGLAAIVGSLGGSMKMLMKIIPKDMAPQMIAVGLGLMGLAGAILIMAFAVKSLSTLSWEELAKGLLGLGVCLTGLALSVRMMGDPKRIAGIGKTLLGLSLSIGILAIAVWGFAQLQWEEMAKGLLGLGASLAMLVLFTKGLDKSIGVKQAMAFVILAGALNIFGSSISAFANMDLASIAQGLGSMGLALLIVIGAMKLMPEKQLVKNAFALIMVSIALGKMVVVLGQMSGLSLQDAAKGIVVFAIALVVLTKALDSVKKKALPGAAAMGVVAASMAILLTVLQSYAAMSLAELGKAMAALAASLLILGFALKFMSKSEKGTLVLILIAGAIRILTPALQELANLSLAQIAGSLLALAGVFTIFGVAGLLLGPMVPILLMLSVAIAGIGLSVLAVGAGLSMFVNSLILLGQNTDTAAKGIIALGLAIMSLIPAFALALVAGVTAFVVGLVAQTLVIGKAISDLMIGILRIIAEHVPQIVDIFGQMIVDILKQLTDHIPDIVREAGNLITAMIDAFSDNMQNVIDAGGRLVVKFIEGIGDNLTDVIDAGVDLVVKLLEGIGSNAIKIADAARQLVKDIWRAIRGQTAEQKSEIENSAGGIADSMGDGLSGRLRSLAAAGSRVMSAAWNLGKRAVDAVRGGTESASPSKATIRIGGYMGDGLEIGLKKAVPGVEKSSHDLGRSAVESMRKSISDIRDYLDTSMDTSYTVTPVLDMSQVTKDAAKLGHIIGKKQIQVDTSYSRAKNLAEVNSSKVDNGPVSVNTNKPEIVFNQYNNSPKALSTADIYRHTRNHLSRTKEAIGAYA
jgi:hypothetical protein